LSEGYLLDTSIVSALYPGRPEATPELIGWMRSHEDKTFFSSVTIFELTQGIEKLRRAGARSRATALGHWVDELIVDFGARILDVDVDIARQAGSLSDAALAIGRHPGVADILIAATAKAHDLVLLTRNMRHFQPLGIAFADPLAALPD
jgi:predicted nucleic acid-binding protein